MYLSVCEMYSVFQGNLQQDTKELTDPHNLNVNKACSSVMMVICVDNYCLFCSTGLITKIISFPSFPAFGKQSDQIFASSLRRNHYPTHSFCL